MPRGTPKRLLTPIRKSYEAGVTGKCREVYYAICTFTKKAGYPPTVREIGKAVGLKSPAAVQYHLDELESVGLIRRYGKARTLVVL